MAYFNYILSDHLNVPQKILSKGDNLSYQGVTIASAVNPFEADHLHLNFFNLAKSTIDATSRLTILESYPQNATSYKQGYLTYSGTMEQNGSLYGGKPFVKKGTLVPTFPYDASQANKRGFQIAVHGGVNLIDPNGSLWVDIVVGDGTGTEDATLASLVTRINSRLKYSEKNESYSFSIGGDVNPTASWATTFALLSPTNTTSFMIDVNFGETVKTVTLSSASPTADLTLLASTLTSLINIQGVTVTSNGTYLTVSGDSNRLAGGITSIRLVKTEETSVLDWLGLSKTGDTINGIGTLCYDFQSIFEAVANVDNTLTLQSTRLGVEQPGTLFILRDKVVDDIDVKSFLSASDSGFGFLTIGTEAQIHTHTRAPLPSYDTILNFGGDFQARDGYFRNIYFDGAFNFTGLTLFEGIKTSQLLEADAGIETTTLVATGAISALSLATPTITTESLTVTGNGTFGDSATDAFTFIGDAMFAEGIATPNNKTSLIGGVSFLGLGAIDTLTVGNLIVGSSLVLSTSALTVDRLRVTGTGIVAGNFNAGGTLPSTLGNTLNYEGELKATKLFTANPSSAIAGTAITLDPSTKEIRLSSSDRRLKENISPLTEDSTAILLALNPVRYSFLADPAKIPTIGFIAQEIRPLIPETVFGDEEKEMLGVNFTNMLPHIVRGFQQLHERVMHLESAMDILTK